MEIGLIRVDSRLIHGQVITKWLNYSKANVIVLLMMNSQKIVLCQKYIRPLLPMELL